MSNHETVDVPVEKEVEVKLDPITDLIQTTVERNISAWQAGYDEGYKAGRNDLLESHCIDVDGFFDDPDKVIKNHEK